MVEKLVGLLWHGSSVNVQAKLFYFMLYMYAVYLLLLLYASLCVHSTFELFMSYFTQEK